MTVGGVWCRSRCLIFSLFLPGKHFILKNIQLFTHVHTSTIHSSQEVEAIRVHPLKQNWHLHTMEYFSALKYSDTFLSQNPFHFLPSYDACFFAHPSRESLFSVATSPRCGPWHLHPSLPFISDPLHLLPSSFWASTKSCHLYRPKIHKALTSSWAQCFYLSSRSCSSSFELHCRRSFLLCTPSPP